MLVNLDDSVLQVVDGVAEREQGERQDQVGEVAGGVGHELLSSELAGVHGNVQRVAHGTCRVVEELDELVLVAPTERLSDTGARASVSCDRRGRPLTDAIELLELIAQLLAPDLREPVGASPLIARERFDEAVSFQ